MRSKTCKLHEGFRIAFDHGGIQAAEMVIAPGESEGGPDNVHSRSDQWLLVLDGSGLAIVEGKRRQLRRGSLLLIEHGERHEIRNTGRGLLVTINHYSPPAYAQNGTLKASGKPASTGKTSRK